MKNRLLIIYGIVNLLFLVVIGLYLYHDINGKMVKATEVENNKMTIVDDPYYIDKTALFKELAKNEKDIVFLGDSLTDYCEWSELLQNSGIKNRGIAGDTTLGVLNRLDEIIEMKPTKIFLLIGTNDLIAGRKRGEIIADYEQIISRCTQSLPETKVYVQSIPPVNSKLFPYIKSQAEIINLNQEIKKLANQYHVEYLDLHSVLVTPEGELAREYTTDGLHLNSKGYDRWKGLLIQYLN